MQETIRQLPEYPAITVLRDFTDDPEPNLVITRINEEPVQLYIAQVGDVPEGMRCIWFMPMPALRLWNGLVYKASTEKRQEHLVSQYTEALDLVPSVLMRWAL